MKRLFRATALALLGLAVLHAHTASAIVLDDFNENSLGVSTRAFIGGFLNGPPTNSGNGYLFFPDGNLGSIQVMGDVRHSAGTIPNWNEGATEAETMELLIMTRTLNHLGADRGVWEMQDLALSNARAPMSEGGFATIWWDAGPNGEDTWSPDDVPLNGYNTDWGGIQVVGNTTNKIIDWDHSQPSSKAGDTAFDLMQGDTNGFLGFEIDAWHSSSNVNATLSVEVYALTGSTDFVTISWPASATYVTYQIPFSAFGNIAMSEWTNVGSVRLTLDVDGEDFQGRIDEIRTTIPEPGTISLLLLGGGMIFGLRRKKRA